MIIKPGTGPTSCWTRLSRLRRTVSPRSAELPAFDQGRSNTRQPQPLFRSGSSAGQRIASRRIGRNRAAEAAWRSVDGPSSGTRPSPQEKRLRPNRPGRDSPVDVVSGDDHPGVEGQVVAVDAGVAEQEFGGVGHVGHGDDSLGGSASDGRMVGYVSPAGAITDHTRMQGIDAVRRDLDGEGLHQPGDAAVVGRDHRRPRVGAVLGQAAEEHDGGALA